MQVSKLRMVSVWLVVDLDTKEGRQLAAAAVKHVKSSNQVEEMSGVYIFHYDPPPLPPLK